MKLGKLGMVGGFGALGAFLVACGSAAGVPSNGDSGGAAGSGTAGTGGSESSGGSTSAGSGGESGSGGAGGSGAGGAGGTPQTGLGGASSVSLTRVDIYQAVRRPLMVNGQAAQSDIPLIAGRPALVRLSYQRESGYDGAPITARFTLEGREPLVVTSSGGLTQDSADRTLGSTFNFELPGDVVGQQLSFSAELLQEGGTGSAASRYPAPSGFASVAVAGRLNKLRVKIVPYAYGADGSNRVPDTGGTALDRIRKKLFALYPVSDVEVTVREPVPWQNAISPNGSGWSAVLQNTESLRSREVGANSDVYYYAMFNPAASFTSFCRGGCVLGLANANGRGIASLRYASGIGFPGYVEGTMAHELGHSHGRLHAPCAPGNQIDGVDPGFPHQGARLGDWGYDLAAERLIDPNTYTDIMGYCQNQFVSDYTYKALFARGSRINLMSHAPTRYQLVWLDGAGAARLGSVITVNEALDGDLIEVPVQGADGSTTTRRGYFSEFDHLPGGTLFVPLGDAATLGRARFDVSGVRYAIGG
jgi:hypothetical protein